MTTENNQLPEGFAEPSTSGGRYETRGLKEDTTISYRLFPAMKSLLKRRDLAQYWAEHWWQGVDRKDAGKTRGFPILCLEEKDWNRGGLVVRQCALCLKRKKFENDKTAIEAAGKTKGATKAKIAQAQGAVTKWLKDHGHNGKYHLYVMDRAGTFVILKLGGKVFKKLKAEMKKLEQVGHTPAGFKGVWFDFTRVGNGWDVPDDVVPHRIEKPDGSSTLDFHTFTKEILEDALDAFPSFEDEKARITYTEAQLKELAECNDDPAETNRILGIKSLDEADEGEVADDEPTGLVPDDAVPVAAAAAAPAAAQEPPAEEVDDEEAKLLAALAAKRAARAAAAPAAKPAAAKPVVKPTAATPQVDALAVGDSAFDAMFENP